MHLLQGIFRFMYSGIFCATLHCNGSMILFKKNLFPFHMFDIIATFTPKYCRSGSTWFLKTEEYRKSFGGKTKLELVQVDENRLNTITSPKGKILLVVQI